MLSQMISRLTEEQDEVLPIYREKWRSIATMTEPIDREKVASAIKATYAEINYPEPEILFYTNPISAIERLFAVKNFKEYTGPCINGKFSKRVFEHIQHLIKRQLDEALFIRLRNKIQFPDFPHYPTETNPQASFFPEGVERLIEVQLLTDFDKPEFEFTNICDLSLTLTRPAGWSIWGCMFDFCISVLELQHDKRKWGVLQDLMQCCGFIFLFEKVCIVCDRPCKLSFDQMNKLHAEGEPAIQFADGYSVYAHHGRHLSEERL